jgi:hypothetical protein
MQTYFRVVSRSETDDADDLRRVVASILDTLPQTSECSPMTPHPKGGFSVFLDHRDDDVETIMTIFAENGWMPCF